MFLQNSNNSIISQNEKKYAYFTFYRSLYNIKASFLHNLIYKIKLKYHSIIDILFISIEFVKPRRIIFATNTDLQFKNRIFFKKFSWFFFNNDGSNNKAYIHLIALVFLLSYLIFYYDFYELLERNVFLPIKSNFVNVLQIFKFLSSKQEKVYPISNLKLFLIQIINNINTYCKLRFHSRRHFPRYIYIIGVCILYAWTSVASGTRTTTQTPNFYKLASFAALLASIYIYLATLTIAAQYYASKFATHPLAQLPPKPLLLSLINDSNFNILYSSKIVLSRLFNSSVYYITDSDVIFIRIIQENSKNLLFTKNFKTRKSKSFVTIFRTKKALNTSELIEVIILCENLLISYYQFIKYAVTVLDENILHNTKLVCDRSRSTYYYEKAKHTNTKLQSQTLKSKIFTKLLFTTLTIIINNNFILKSIKPINTVNLSANLIKTSDAWWEFFQQESLRLVNALTQVEEQLTGEAEFYWSMPPSPRYSNNLHNNESTVLVLVITAVVFTVALGLVTCVLSHYRGATAAHPHDAGQSTTTAPMLSVVSAGATAGVGGMDRLRSRGAALELAASRDRQVRLHAVHTDIAINLPPSITLPDGEDHPFTNSRLHIRDPEQESEIYQKCIKPPPNRSVLESESPPPYRSNSAGLLGSISSTSSGNNDWSGGTGPLMMRCHSMSSTSKRPEAGHSGQKTDFIQRTVKIFTGKKSQPPPAPTLPVVVVPMKLRPNSDLNQNSSSRHKPSV